MTGSTSSPMARSDLYKRLAPVIAEQITAALAPLVARLEALEQVLAETETRRGR